jgi:hypothetical protein
MASQPKAANAPCLRRMLMRLFPTPSKNVLRRIIVTTSLLCHSNHFHRMRFAGFAWETPVDRYHRQWIRFLRHRVQVLGRRVQVLGQRIQPLHRLYFFLTGQAPTAMLRPSNPSSIGSSSAMACQFCGQRCQPRGSFVSAQQVIGR